MSTMAASSSNGMNSWSTADHVDQWDKCISCGRDANQIVIINLNAKNSTNKA